MEENRGHGLVSGVLRLLNTWLGIYTDKQKVGGMSKLRNNLCTTITHCED